MSHPFCRHSGSYRGNHISDSVCRCLRAGVTRPCWKYNSYAMQVDNEQLSEFVLWLVDMYFWKSQYLRAYKLASIKSYRLSPKIRSNLRADSKTAPRIACRPPDSKEKNRTAPTRTDTRCRYGFSERVVAQKARSTRRCDRNAPRRPSCSAVYEHTHLDLQKLNFVAGVHPV